MNDCEQLENLEDIESRLYSELYHNVEAYQDSPQPVEQPPQEALPEVVPEMRRAPRPRPRYFQQHVLNGNKSWTRPEAPSNPDPPPAPPETARDTLLASAFSPSMAEFLSGRKHVQPPPKPVGPFTGVTKKYRKRNRKLKKNLMKNPVAFSGPSTQEAPKRPSVTIFLSDSEDDVVEVKPEPEIPTNCEDGVEVIFIPNPPPEVITLDEDPEPEKVDGSIGSHVSETSNDSPGKNDYITALDIELNNAPQCSLFDKPEFVKPTEVPQTPCGSESTSSCTIDLTALQAGPFTEHEFPHNTALFEDENLESFGNLITPGRRESSPLPSDLVESSGMSTPLSSKQKKLPTLSHIEKRIDNDSDHEPVAKVTKRKLSQDDSASSSSKASTSSKKPLKSKKKKHKPPDEEEPQQEETIEEVVIEETKKKSKKKPYVVMVVEETESEETPRKSKGKKRDKNDALDSFLVIDEAIGSSSKPSKRRQAAPRDDADETPKKSKNRKREINDALGSFVVLDETNESVLISSSDSDDLSELPADGDFPDIQLLNCSPHPSHLPVQDDESPAKDSSKPVDLLIESVDDVLGRMSNDPCQWTVLESDRLRLRTKGTGRRCNRCREVGHVAIRCPNNVSPKCNLCGAEHYEARCPDKMCTGCGRSQGYSSSYCKFCFDDRHRQCKICWNNGHISQSCPDLWRRYHLTTEEGPLVRHQGPSSKPRHQLWCSGCAKSGHLVHECRVFINADYPKSDPFIRSYKDIYNTTTTDADKNYGSPPSSDQYGIPSLLLPNEFQQNFFFNQGYCGSPQGQYNVNFYNNNNNAQNYQNNVPSNAQLQLIQALIPQNNVTFHDQLPNYINLNQAAQQQQQPQQQIQQNFVNNFIDNRQANMSPADRRLLRNAQSNALLFFKKSPQQIQQFIHAELRKLDKYVENLKGIVGDLRRNIDKQGRNYKNLNMVLFGVYHLNDGNLHLDKLKNFQSCYPRAPLSIAKRKDLFKAYNYIFGSDGHEDDNKYKELLLNAI